MSTSFSGTKDSPEPPWGVGEIAWLETNYSALGPEAASEYLGRPIESVKAMARKLRLGVGSPPPGAEWTSVRTLAMELSITSREVIRAARKLKYTIYYWGPPGRGRIYVSNAAAEAIRHEYGAALLRRPDAEEMKRAGFLSSLDAARYLQISPGDFHDGLRGKGPYSFLKPLLADRIVIAAGRPKRWFNPWHLEEVWRVIQKSENRKSRRR